MAEPPEQPGPPGPGRGRGRAAGRNKSFRKAREAIEDAHYLDVSLEDVQKYFSPDSWRKMTSLNLHSVPPSSVQKYFDPVAWEKLQRLGCLRGRPSSSSSSATPTVTAARGCFSPRSWETLGRLNVVPAAQGDRDEATVEQAGSEEEEDGFLGHEMDDNTSLSSAVRLDGLEDRVPPRAAVSDRVRQYFSSDQWRKLEEVGVLDSALTRLGKETSV